MKTKLFTVMAASALFFAACKNAPNEQTMKDIVAFEASWNEMSNKANTLQTELQSSLDNCAAACSKHEGMAMEGVKDEAKAKMEECMTACKGDKTAFEEMKKAWETEGATWAEAQKSFADLKDKATKGAITNDEAVKSLGELKTKMEAGNKGLEDWSAKISTAKETCTKHCGDMDGCAKMMEEVAAKDPKKK